MLSNIMVRTENKYLKLKLKLKHCSCDVEENEWVSLPYIVYCTVYRVTSMYSKAGARRKVLSLGGGGGERVKEGGGGSESKLYVYVSNLQLGVFFKD